MLSNDLEAKRKRKRGDYSYHLDYRTRWSDNDMYHHLNNSIYNFLIDSIVNAYLIEKCGLEPNKSEQVGLVVSSYCDYFGSLEYPNVAELGIRAVKLGKSSVMYEVGIFQKGEEQVKAVGGSVHVFVDQQTRKVTRDGMNKTVRQGLAALLDKDSAKL